MVYGSCNSGTVRGQIDPRAFVHRFCGIFLGLNIVRQFIIESNAVACIFDCNTDIRSLHGTHFYSVGYKLIRLTKILQFDNRATGFFIFANIGKFSTTAILNHKADQISGDIEIRRINN